MRLPTGRPVVCLITSGELTSENFLERQEELIGHCVFAAEHGVSLIQVREKELQTDILCELTAKIVAETQQYPTQVLVNERFDIAMASGASGVHLTSTGLPLSRVRELVPNDLVIGISTHTDEEVSAASRAGADYVLFGPLYDTPGKPVVCGIGELKKLTRAFPDLPILGLGGIDPSNVSEVLDAGAAGIAAIRSLNDRRKMVELLNGVSQGGLS